MNQCLYRERRKEYFHEINYSHKINEKQAKKINKIENENFLFLVAVSKIICFSTVSFSLYYVILIKYLLTELFNRVKNIFTNYLRLPYFLKYNKIYII